MINSGYTRGKGKHECVLVSTAANVFKYSCTSTLFSKLDHQLKLEDTQTTRTDICLLKFTFPPEVGIVMISDRRSTKYCFKI
jgi:hypothetical protein